MGNIVSIVGRPNVGKSTLFNRLIERRQAIMDNQSGVTRDRHYGSCDWTGRTFTVIDTGGYVEGSEDIFEAAIREQVLLALKESTVVIFMVDCHDGLTDMDKDFAKIVRASGKKTVIAANKADDQKWMMSAPEFYALGLGEVHPIASNSGSGTGDMLDEVVSYFEDEDAGAESEIPRIAVVGRPNVGKSSLVNLLVGEQRTIVTDQAGTTRDAIDVPYRGFGHEFILVDTAGIKRKSAKKTDIELYAEVRSINAVQKADVCIIMIDAENGLESQDMSIINLAHRHKKGVLVAVNKWDLVEKETNTAKEFEDFFKERLGELNYIPFIFTSMVEKQRINKLVNRAIEIHKERKKRITTSKLNDQILPEILKNPPPSHRGNYIKIKYITQLPTKTPAFAFFCNYPEHIKKSYERFLEKTVRRLFGFEGVPIKIIFRKK